MNPSSFTALLFSEIDGSTQLWRDDRERMSAALAGHDKAARAAVESNRGVVVKMTGDGMFAAFLDPTDAIRSALAVQQALADPASTNGIPLRVRCGLHAGSVEHRDNDFFGPPVNRAARIMAAAHGGQVLLSHAMANCVCDILPEAVSLRDLGNVRLKDLATPEQVFQLVHPELRLEFPALRSLESRPNNLPQQLTSFIGRERELTEVLTMLGKARLVTLLGVGGLGKTRLSLQVAADVMDDYADGVWLAELASLTHEHLVPQAVASVLGVKEEAGRSVSETLLKFVKDRQLLLVLDNCEHVARASAELARQLLQSGPQVKILATSREPLHIAGESIYQLPPLSVPDPQVRLALPALTQCEAVRLFVDRAVAAQPAFRVTDQNAKAVADICHRLDGIPLALELAAARVRALAVGQIDARLSDCFRLLTGGDRTALPRQQTLRACIDWSYDLLHEPEQRLLQRLSVFAGGWTLAAAEEICAGEGVGDEDVLDLLTSLHDKSLVVAEATSDRLRYRLLETVRQYARERLDESGVGEVVRERHRDYFLALAKEAEPKLIGVEQAAWLDCLEEEHENLRASLDWSLGAEGSLRGLRLCGALHRFWWARGYISEGREWCVRALAKAGADERTQDRAKALNVAGVLAYHQGDYPAARTLHQEALAIRRLLGDRKGVAASLNNLGLVASDLGDYAASRTLYEESLAIKRELGDRPGIANSLNNLGNVAYDHGDLASARALYESSLAIAREVADREAVGRLLGNLGNVAMHQRDFSYARVLQQESLAIKRELGHRQRIASSLNSLGNLAIHQGDLASAHALLREGLTIGREVGDRLGIAQSLEGLATVITAMGNPLGAARIWGAAEELRAQIGTPLPPKDQLNYERSVAATRAAVADDSAFDSARQEGRALTLDQAIELALENWVKQP